jgi:hypothetical protein
MVVGQGALVDFKGQGDREAEQSWNRLERGQISMRV